LRLLSLALRNFKGQRDFTLSLGGADASVFGDNGVGKTTLADAWHWLLLGKDSKGASDFGIKTLDSDGDPLSRIEHSVEARIETDRGVVTLGKVYREEWTTKRGGSTEAFDGHTTLYSVGGVPRRKAEYDAYVAGLLPQTSGSLRPASEADRLFRVLSDPSYLVEGIKDMRVRRSMLFEAFGDVSDADVIAAHDSLAELPKILGTHGIDDFRKIAGASLKKLREEKATIPARINEADLALPKIVPGDWESALETARLALTEAQNLRATVVAGGAKADKTARLRTVEGEMIQIVNRLRELPDPVRTEAIAYRRELDVRRQEVADSHTSLQRRIQEADADLTKIERVRQKMLSDHKVEKEREFKAPDTPDVCPSCGQQVPEERRETVRSAALAAFNDAKARRVGEIVDAGRELRRRIDALSADLEVWRTEAAASAATIVRLNAERASHVVPEPVPIVPTDDPAYAALVAEQAGLNRDIAQIEADSVNPLLEIDEEIREAQAKVDEANRNLQAADLRESGLARKKKLADDETRLGAEIGKLDGHLHLCDEFVRAKVGMLTDRVNAAFETVRWKLFETQVNGGLVEICEATVDGVEYRDLNTAAQINAELDCVDAFARRHGFAPPVFVDRAESVTRLRPTAGQQVRLVVSEADKSLRVVVAAGGRAAETRELQETLL